MRSASRFAATAWLTFWASVVWPGVAAAGEGVVEINQAAALAGNVTPGDAPGFPVTISRSGSYRLTGNLDSPVATGAIDITASNVSLDLGGFVVQSTNTCSGYPVVTCSVLLGVPGIQAAGFLVSVRNGSVLGMGGSCVQLNGNSSEVDRVYALGCGYIGINLGAASRVTNSFAGSALGAGIQIRDGGFAQANEVRGNRLEGILFYLVRLDGEALENRVFDNGTTGIASTNPYAVLGSKNVVRGNAGAPLAGVASTGDNLCNGTLC